MAPNWPGLCKNLTRNKVILAKLSVMTILDHSAPIRSRTTAATPYQDRKNSVKIKFLGGIFLAHQGSACRDIPGMSRTKTLRKAPLSVVLDREWPGCPAIWAGTSHRIRQTLCKKALGRFFVSYFLASLCLVTTW